MLIAIISLAVVSVGSAVAFIIYEKNKKKQIGLPKKKISNKNFNKFYQKFYLLSSRFRLTNNILLRVRKKVETLAVYDEYSLRRQVAQTMVTIISVILVIILALMVIRPGWLISFWIMVGLVFATDLMIDFFIVRIEKKLLPQIKEFLKRLRYFYAQTHMIDEASFESINYTGSEMKVQAQRIHNTLTSVNPEEEQLKYEEVAPNRFLKVISGLMVLVKEKGDVIDPENERGSAFTRGIAAITKELNLEIMYRSKLAYRLRFLAPLTLIPIIFALPIQSAIVYLFPIMSRFYESRIGFLGAIFIYAFSIGMYFVIRKIKDVSDVSYQTKLNKIQWEKRLYEKFKIVRLIVKIFSPNYKTVSYAKKSQLIKDANEPLEVEWLTLRQLVLSVITLIILVSGMLYAHKSESQSALYNIIPSSMMTSNVSDEEYEEFKKTTDFDREMIMKLQSASEFTADGIMQTIANQMGIDEVENPKVKQAYDRIMEKYTIVENAYFKWWELLIILLIVFGIWYIPEILLQLQKNLRRKDMENEVHQFLTIISILREFNSIGVLTLLVWLERFSVTFKEPLQKCILNFDSGPEEALEELSNDISFEAFQQIVERLKLSISRLSVKEAFEDIELEREFYLEQREEYNTRSISNRGDFAYLASVSPVATLLILHVLVPIIYISTTHLQSMMTGF
ncbi:hypothetical protein [Lysinibacillus sphaericus]|uniref:Uncharacterized protein n=1 Tax=Lysinibacillus sphaericus (strain C3-41) TaxID=444177 RepID=B1I0P9_LYSSC|nr:hypothetical protein [Lysinibacillus sphaericus]MBE5085768.1 hypothetical protein [Bacillus thuringiensis]ACA42408.1 conserved hypothetical protein [Lysinibacillus sphaericus C3-41]AMO35365.1 hypothetical protein AR327_23020 [Lysinibacillus sphaericus]AMR93032.1 hypothetical protein A1T07_22765 [Lysinibacillus sphaericus]MBG9710622.1 hypothetical protein [Lysinibacillus sphaericus]